MAAYSRILLKISGEALMGNQEFGLAADAVKKTCQQIAELHKKGIELGVVIGGGNIFRAVQGGVSLNMRRVPADQSGMIATLVNGLVLQDALISEGCQVRLLTALECPAVAESYRWENALKYLAEGNILLFAGGTGNPFFTTDTVAALRACELNADVLLKATTRVDGVYDKDPRVHKDAKKFTKVTYQELIEKQLGVLDFSAASMCRAAKIPIRVINLFQQPLREVLTNEKIGTLIEG